MLKDGARLIEDVYHIPRDRVKRSIMINDENTIIEDTDGNYFLDTLSGVYSSEIIDLKAKELFEQIC